MKNSTLFFSAFISSMLVIHSARADYIDRMTPKDIGYDLDYFTIPAVVGANTGTFHDNGSIPYGVTVSRGRGSYIELSINGTLSGDGVTWVTSNPGIGIQYRLESGTSRFNPASSETAPTYRMNLTGTGSVHIATTYLHLRYRLVRLLDKIPPGPITSAPQVTLMAYNPDGAGTAFTSGVILSKILNQPIVTACTINAPTEVKLPNLYGNALVNGAQGATDVPTVTLTNCPGAINGIAYNLSAVYGTYNSANSVLNTVAGSDYAQNVYIQVQNRDGSAFQGINSAKALNYTGSGDYDIPDFKVAYYVDNASTVTTGKVSSAIEVKLTYN